jgi:hypothetical protein
MSCTVHTFAEENKNNHLKLHDTRQLETFESETFQITTKFSYGQFAF